MKQSHYTQEELDLIEALERGPIVSSASKEQDLQDAYEAADNFFKEKRLSNILLTDADIYGIQKIAREQGIPYETCLSNIVHEYVKAHK